MDEDEAGFPYGDTYRVGLVLAAVQLVAVVEDILIGGVQAGLDAVSDHLAGTWRALKFLYLSRKTQRF